MIFIQKEVQTFKLWRCPWAADGSESRDLQPDVERESKLEVSKRFLKETLEIPGRGEGKIAETECMEHTSRTWPNEPTK